MTLNFVLVSTCITKKANKFSVYSITESNMEEFKRKMDERDGVAHGKLLAGDVVRSVNGVVVRSSERLSMQLKARTRLTFELDRRLKGTA